MEAKIEEQLKEIVTKWIYTKLEDTTCLVKEDTCAFIKFKVSQGRTTGLDKAGIYYNVTHQEAAREERVDDEQLSHQDTITVPARTKHVYAISVEDERVKSLEHSHSNKATLNFGLAGSFAGIGLNAGAGIEWTHTNSEGKTQRVTNKRDFTVEFAPEEREAKYSIKLYRTATLVIERAVLELTGAIELRFKSDYSATYVTSNKQLQVKKKNALGSVTSYSPTTILVPLSDVIADLQQMGRLPDKDLWVINAPKVTYTLEWRQLKAIHGISLKSELRPAIVNQDAPPAAGSAVPVSMSPNGTTPSLSASRTVTQRTATANVPGTNAVRFLDEMDRSSERRKDLELALQKAQPGDTIHLDGAVANAARATAYVVPSNLSSAQLSFLQALSLKHPDSRSSQLEEVVLKAGEEHYPKP